MSFSLGELAMSLDMTVQGDAGLIVKSITSLDQAGADQLAFLSNPLYPNQAVSSGAGAITMSFRDLETLESQDHAAGRNWPIAASPYTAFARVAQCFVALVARPIVPGIHPNTSTEKGIKVPASCSIGPNATTETDAVLGEHVRIVGNSFVGADTRIGGGALLHANVSICHNCKVRTRCILHSGVMIGVDGFDFIPDFGPQGGERVKIPQVGRAVIGDDVETGANTATDCGAMAGTIAEQGYKTDNQVQVTHNVHIGVYTAIADCAVISDSTKIERYCTIGGTANFAGHLTTADRMITSDGTSIIRSITKPGGHFISILSFMSHDDWECNAAIIRGLTRIRGRLQQLEQRAKDLQQQS